MILDCCYAGCAVRGSGPGQKELLAACEKKALATGHSTANVFTFSRTLINHLETHARTGEPFRISDLHVDLARTKLQPSPFYAILPGTSNSPIMLFPKYATRNNIIQERREESVLIHLHLSGDPAPKAWNEWLTTNIPEAIAKVQIGAVYRSYSTVLVISISLELWSFFPQNAAYSYIGIVRSDNLHLGATTDAPEIATSEKANRQTTSMQDYDDSSSDTLASDSESWNISSSDTLASDSESWNISRPTRIPSLPMTLGWKTARPSPSPPWKRKNMGQNPEAESGIGRTLVASTAKASSAWTQAEDNVLIQERVRGQGWQAIAEKFPFKSPNACQERHEHLMERWSIDGWDGKRFEHLASEYTKVRKEMWSILADRVGANWQTLESKVMYSTIRFLDIVYDH